MNNKNKLKIKVLDAMMGAGKSTVMQEFINNSLATKPDTKFIYLTPFLTEVERFKSKVPQGNFIEPTNKGTGKVRDFMSLIHRGQNVATTHACFKGLNLEDAEDIRQAGYVLVIDEAVEALEHMQDFKPDFIQDLVKAETVKVKDNGTIEWNHISKPLNTLETDAYIDLASMCSTSSVYLVNSKFFVNEFPVEIMKAFKEVVVMTYIFEGSVMAAWANMHEVEVVNINNKFNLPFSEEELKERARNLIKLYEPRKVLDFSLSHTWYKNAIKDKELFSDLKKTCSSFCKSIDRSDGIKSADILVTCPKDNWKKENPKTQAPSVAGQGYTKATWLASNARATNDYADKKAVIYLMSKHPNVFINAHLNTKESPIDRDKYALSEMLQFIWRGCIRKGEPMHLYIPSKFMKNLFKEWLNR